MNGPRARDLVMSETHPPPPLHLVMKMDNIGAQRGRAARASSSAGTKSARCQQTSHPGCQSLNLAPLHESILASTWQVIANLPMQKRGRRAVIVVKKGLFALRSRRAN